MSAIPNLSPWPSLNLIAEVLEGNRNQVWQGDLDGTLVSVRRSRREPESLRWELDLLGNLAAHDFWVPEVIPTATGSLSADGVVVQRWLDGSAPDSVGDWTAVADELQRLHTIFADHPQRPSCCAVTTLRQVRRSVDADLDAMPAEEQARVTAVFDLFSGTPTSLIHGDPDASNIRIGPDGRVGLLDWDESRVDLPWHDLSNLGVAVIAGQDRRRAEDLSNAWEAANGWIAEPQYARRRLAALKARNCQGEQRDL